MSRFQKIQKWLSVIPFYSTLFIAVVTYIKLHKAKVSAKFWIKYILTFVLSFLSVIILNEVFMTGKNPVLNIIVSGLVFTCANFYFVELQTKCTTVEEKQNMSGIIDDNNKPSGFITFAKKYKFLLITIVILVGLGCVCLRVFYIQQTSIIEDTNGADDFSLNTITAEMIEKTKYSDYTSFVSSSGYDGKPSAIKDKRFESADYDQTRQSAESFNGIMIANATKTSMSNVSLEITSTVESGNLAISVYVENDFYCDVNINSTEKVMLDNISGKMIYVKVAGENAKMSVSVTRKTGDGSMSCDSDS